ncbi:MAG: hypothetical protein KatS3mg124_2063 [Porticoccaceae bacterium]|nr:MAG: hypothetical protein KatS3mg124_2063 [Porticoccaceae bacterium]
MTYFRPRSIRTTLIALLVLASTFSVGLATAGFLVVDWLSLRRVLAEQLEVQAGIAAANLVAALAFGDREAAAATLDSFAHETDILAAALFAEGSAEPFVSYRRDPTAPDLSRTTAPPEGALLARRPVLLEGERLGEVVVLSDLSPWRDRQEALIQTALLLAAATVGLAFLLAARLQGLVTRPIEALSATVREILAKGDYRLRAPKVSEDELGRLVDAFNAMLDQIEWRDRQLSAAREELEAKVQERTAELVELTRMLEHQAFHDELTGLANRATFDDHLRLAIHQAERRGESLAVLFLDLDRFKLINDTLGHRTGDRLLRALAERLSGALRESDTLARLGGDEFAVLLGPGAGAQTATEVARKLLALVSQPFPLDGHQLQVTASIGICLFPEDGRDAETLLRHADTAMYQAKERGKNRFTFFAAEMNRRAQERLRLESRLRQALAEGRFRVHYQPRLAAHDLTLVGVEALVRWPAEEEAFAPETFVPLAEECGLISQLDDWVLETACRELLEACGGPPPFRLAVNFSMAQFIRGDLDRQVAEVLARTGFPADRLEIEITESLFGPGDREAERLLRALRRLGVAISVDDFGTAYSSLSRLKQLPVQTLKIDRSFVRDLGRDPEDEALVRAILAMAESLGLKSVAEGIECEAQLAFIRRHGCTAVQGFLFSPPLPIAELAARWLATAGRAP